MANPADAVKKAAKKVSDAYRAGNQETEGLGAELKAKADATASAMGEPEKKAPVVGEPAPMKPAQGPYGSRPGEKRLPAAEWAKPLGQSTVPVYDKGGKVNVHDGKHQVAILKEGERVLTPEQNEDYEKDLGMKDYDEGGKVSHYTPEEKKHFARAMHSLHQGGLHRHFGMDPNEPIPMEKKQEAANSDNKHVAAMGRMAIAMAGWKHHGHHAKD